MSKVSTCLWFGKDAEAAVRFYVSLVPGSSVEHVLRSPGVWPGGEAGDVIMVIFTLGGQSFQALNGGAPADYGTAASISVDAPTRRRSIGCGRRSPPTAGRKSCAAGCATNGACRANCARGSAGLLADPDPAVSGRVFAAMMEMVKLDIVARSARLRGNWGRGTGRWSTRPICVIWDARGVGCRRGCRLSPALAAEAPV